MLQQLLVALCLADVLLPPCVSAAHHFLAQLAPAFTELGVRVTFPVRLFRLLVLRSWTLVVAAVLVRPAVVSPTIATAITASTVKGEDVSLRPALAPRPSYCLLVFCQW